MTVRAGNVQPIPLRLDRLIIGRRVRLHDVVIAEDRVARRYVDAVLTGCDIRAVQNRIAGDQVAVTAIQVDPILPGIVNVISYNDVVVGLFVGLAGAGGGLRHLNAMPTHINDLAVLDPVRAGGKQLYPIAWNTSDDAVKDDVADGC